MKAPIEDIPQTESTEQNKVGFSIPINMTAQLYVLGEKIDGLFTVDAKTFKIIGYEHR